MVEIKEVEEIGEMIKDDKIVADSIDKKKNIAEKVEDDLVDADSEIRFDEKVEAKPDFETIPTENVEEGKIYSIPNDVFKSIFPPDVFNSFVGFYGEEASSKDLHYNEETHEYVDLIDVNKEMNVEALEEIAQKAMMANLKEVNSDVLVDLKTESNGNSRNDSINSETLE
ncbi:hypothetical protein Hanom_Chr16g01472951 [Helianthus anomalus]